jgi:hypothetical protein
MISDISSQVRSEVWPDQFRHRISPVAISITLILEHKLLNQIQGDEVVDLSRHQPLCEFLLRHSVIDGSWRNYPLPVRVRKRKLEYCLMSQGLQESCAVLEVTNDGCIRAVRPGIHNAIN